VKPLNQRGQRVVGHGSRFHGHVQLHPLLFVSHVGGTLELALVQRFHALHQELYTFSDPAAPVEIVNLRVEAIGQTGRITLPEIGRATSRRAEPAGTRPAALGESLAPTPIYRREALLAGHVIEGPAIVDQLDCTTVILPGQHAVIDRLGNMLIAEGAP
ncbi:MAG: hypothetical protein AAFR44_12670, partial [Pseudomonadota bacterium]